MYIPSASTSSQVLERAQTPSSGFYDGVHDIYGPGAFIAWIITGYCVVAQVFAPVEGSLYWNIDKDLGVFILYPPVAASQLIYKVSHYDGPRADFWESFYSDGPDKPGVAPIWACTLVCTTAFPLNACLLVLLRKSKIRSAFLLAAEIWLLIGLLYAWAPCTGFLVMVAWCSGFLMIASLAVMTCLFPPFIPVFVIMMFQSAYEQCFEVSFSDMGPLGTIGRRLWGCLGCLLILYTAAALLALPGFYVLLIPHSNHKISDLGQVLALAAATFNAGFSLLPLWREYGRRWVDWSLGRSTWDRP